MRFSTVGCLLTALGCLRCQRRLRSWAQSRSRARTSTGASVLSEPIGGTTVLPRVDSTIGTVQARGTPGVCRRFAALSSQCRSPVGLMLPASESSSLTPRALQSRPASLGRLVARVPSQLLQGSAVLQPATTVRRACQRKRAGSGQNHPKRVVPFRITSRSASKRRITLQFCP